MLRNFWFYISKKRRRQFWLIVLLMIISSVAEVISLGSVIPFLGILTEPDQIYKNSFAQPIIDYFNITGPKELILPLTVIFITAIIFANFIRLTLLYTLTRCSVATGADISINMYRRTLHQEFSIHMSRNSGEIINSIVNKTKILTQDIIIPILIIISSTIILIGIVTILLTINFTVSLLAFIIFSILYYIITKLTKKQLTRNSLVVANNSTKMIKLLQEALGGIRYVLIDRKQNFYSHLFENAVIPYWRALGNLRIFSQSPRFIIETIALTFFAILAYLMSKDGNNISNSLPMLGALVLGAQRLIPVLQALYGSYSTYVGAQASFNDILVLLDQPLPEEAEKNKNNQHIEKLTFEKKIFLSDLSFRYKDKTPWILRNVHLTINKGDRIGFIGTTGSGKSTLIDIIMGLLTPTNGEIYIDNQKISMKNKSKWQANISHVPQHIYISDSTIAENIAFGVPKKHIDLIKLKKAANQAKISDLIESWENGYNTIVGERGVLLSGGQLQRIGIARALYKQASLFIFDEATNALDNKTEDAVMRTIENLQKDLTILIIAHRLTTLKNCDKIIRINNKNIEIVKHNNKSVKNLETK